MCESESGLVAHPLREPGEISLGSFRQARPCLGGPYEGVAPTCCLFGEMNQTTVSPRCNGSRYSGSLAIPDALRMWGATRFRAGKSRFIIPDGSYNAARPALWFKRPGVSMKPFPRCRYLIGVKPRKRSLKPVKASNKGDQEFLMQLML